jgi:hypothetical protein
MGYLYVIFLSNGSQSGWTCINPFDLLVINHSPMGSRVWSPMGFPSYTCRIVSSHQRTVNNQWMSYNPSNIWSWEESVPLLIHMMWFILQFRATAFPPLSLSIPLGFLWFQMYRECTRGDRPLNRDWIEFIGFICLFIEIKITLGGGGILK